MANDFGGGVWIAGLQTRDGVCKLDLFGAADADVGTVLDGYFCDAEPYA